MASPSNDWPTAKRRDKHALIYVGIVLAIVMLAEMAVVSYRSIGHVVERVENVVKTQRIFLVNQEALIRQSTAAHGRCLDATRVSRGSGS